MKTGGEVEGWAVYRVTSPDARRSGRPDGIARRLFPRKRAFRPVRTPRYEEENGRRSAR